MKTSVKQSYEEFANNIAFPTLIYSSETGKVQVCNQQALNMLGKEIKSVKKIKKDNPHLEDAFNKLQDGETILYNQQIVISEKLTLEVDIEINRIEVQHGHLVILFFESSYRNLFVRHNKDLLPRIVWVNKKIQIVGSNRVFQDDMGCSNKEMVLESFEEYVDGDTAEKIQEDIQSVLTTKKPILGRLQLLKPYDYKGLFCRFNYVPLYNKNATVIGVVFTYSLILNREGYKHFYNIAIKENDILNRIIGRMDTIVISWVKDVKYRVQYVSGNISRLGYLG